jgi:phenylacetate-CoA ligase
MNSNPSLLLKRLLEHPDAPHWWAHGSDRLEGNDVEVLREFGRQLTGRSQPPAICPSPFAVEWVRRYHSTVPFYREHIPQNLDPAQRWEDIPTTSREDLAVQPELFVPDDVDLERMLVYRTSGTTGHALMVPHHPRSVACYQPMMEYVAGRYGIAPRFDAETVACILVCSQKKVVTWASELSYWNGAGFAKVNLRSSEWSSPESPRRYFADFQPVFLNGDPFAFSDLLKWELPVRPMAMFSTAVALRPGLKKRLLEQFPCPVIDWFSLIESGPIAYACPKGYGHHLLPHDLHVEALDESQRPVPPGVRGELTLTGGRNPFLPLIRYRTQDWGTLDYEPCPCGDPMPRIFDLEGRKPIVFEAADGARINSVDLSRVLRDFPLVQHEFLQRADRSCEITVRPIRDVTVDAEVMRAAMRKVLGDLPIEIRSDYDLGEENHSGKVISYRSELVEND